MMTDGDIALAVQELSGRIASLETRIMTLEARLPPQGLHERWWATYNAVLPALLSLSPDYHVAREHARLIADAEHGRCDYDDRHRGRFDELSEEP